MDKQWVIEKLDCLESILEYHSLYLVMYSSRLSLHGLMTKLLLHHHVFPEVSMC